MQTVIFFLAAGIFAFVAISDFRTRRIPNGFIVAILLLAALRMALTGTPSGALYTLLASAAVFVATFLLFWRGLLGGGDVKLIVATGFLIGYHDVLSFLFVMSLSGGLMAVAPLYADPRAAFAPLRELSDVVRSVNPAATVVSAGMSGDLEAALEGGATHLRIGTALLGDRRLPVL